MPTDPIPVLTTQYVATAVISQLAHSHGLEPAQSREAFRRWLADQHSQAAGPGWSAFLRLTLDTEIDGVSLMELALEYEPGLRDQLRRALRSWEKTDTSQQPQGEICAVCGRPIELRMGGWVHTASSGRGFTLHQAQPRQGKQP